MTSSGASSEKTTAEYYWLLLPQALTGLVDSISFMVVSPSVVFYVRALGGTKEQYGVILSAFSFASFLCKPCLGYWCDRSGYKFRAPYLASLIAAMLGGILYFAASGASSPHVAIATVFLGRLLGGVGAANSTLGFTYIAQMIPRDKMTKFSTVLSMMRVLGMVTAPGMNVLLADLQGFSIFNIEVTPLNAVGLFLIVTNAISFAVICLLLKEPESDQKPDASPVGETSEDGTWAFVKQTISLDILLPICSILVLNANFQLLETGLAPAAANILGWGPIAISTAFGFNALLMFGLIVITYQLASMGFKDATLLEMGLIASIVGYGLLYFMWNQNASLWQFLTPFILSTAAFPFLGAPTRSIFTKAVDAHPALSHQQGTMQAIMSMAASVAGFVAPGLIAAFVLRTPEQVSASADQREFTAWALFAPVLSGALLVGFIYLRRVAKSESYTTHARPSETTSLLQVGGQFTVPAFHPRTEAYRRHSVTLMGIPQISFHPEFSNLGEAKEVSRRTVAF